MTIRMPEANLFDRFLKLIGKKRGVRFPSGVMEQFGPHVYAKALKESFWIALLRPSRKPLPENHIDIFEIERFRKEVSNAADGP